MRYSRRKDVREVRYVVETVGTIVVVGDGRQINGTTNGGGGRVDVELDR